MSSMHQDTRDITQIILRAAEKAREETDREPEPPASQPLKWPMECTVGPGLEGAIACESKIGYVNGSKGQLIYRGYDIFDLCAHSTYEEVSYLLLHGKLPTLPQLRSFTKRLVALRDIPNTMRQLMSFPIEQFNSMAALRLGILFLRRQTTDRDTEEGGPAVAETIGSDEDSIPMETEPSGEARAIYQFAQKLLGKPVRTVEKTGGASVQDCYRLIASTATITAAISRLRGGCLPLEPRPDLSHAANLLYMMTGREPTATEARVMDVALILHADHGMNASTFAAMVVASTLSDVFFSAGAGVAALNGPLHGGANEEVLHMLSAIGSERKVKRWYSNARSRKLKIPGFGHRVYKAYDPRARILGPLAEHLVQQHDEMGELFATARNLEHEVVSTLGKKKKIFPNVDFYSGLVYRTLGIEEALFTPLFAVSRMAGWTARVLEYLEDNRIFRPRAAYTGAFGLTYKPLRERR